MLISFYKELKDGVTEGVNDQANVDGGYANLAFSGRGDPIPMVYSPGSGPYLVTPSAYAVPQSNIDRGSSAQVCMFARTPISC